MTGLCEGSNEPPGSLKASTRLATDLLDETRCQVLAISEKNFLQVKNLLGKRHLGRPRRRWEDNIKMDLREVGYDDRDWINLAQDRDRWRAYVRTAMNLRVP
ncbi:hypothetical protein ANN_21696 [Periplaneta americana]|uniref:Uncharacterized protein n=1 Tax=Periplaneta americana TaxID=6978 RepID=A0ABQ8S6K3_PERAM|nr:hypothetical protein ANN_21696 [Periplaneta americana]